ncbi:60S ribosomal subunit assembly or modification protein [Coemansia sp. Benny D160-2]|nr:60S ribosomal subunit assembly or modification protein [Coemansia sp. Benny D160-2]
MSANNTSKASESGKAQQQPEEYEEGEAFINPEEVADVIADDDTAEPDWMEEDSDHDDGSGSGKQEEEEDQDNGEEQEEGNAAAGEGEEVLLEDDSVQGFFGHGSNSSVFSVDISPADGGLVVSGGEDDTAYVWRADSGAVVAKLDKHTDSVAAVRFSHDGALVAAAGMDGKINVYEPANEYRRCAALDGPDEAQWLAWHPRGSVLLAGGGSDGSMWMWSLPGGGFMNVFNGHSAAVTCAQFTHSGRGIVSGAEDGSLLVWDPKTAAVVRRFSPDDERFHQDGITALALAADDQVVLTGSMDGSAKLVHIGNGTILGSLDNATESVEAVGLCSVLPLAATGSVDGSLSIWDISAMRLRTTLKHDDSVTRLAWHADSPLLTSVSMDCSVRTWDARTGECVRVWRGHQEGIMDFAMTPDGSTIVTASDDGCCLVFAR